MIIISIIPVAKPLTKNIRCPCVPDRRRIPVLSSLPHVRPTTDGFFTIIGFRGSSFSGDGFAVGCFHSILFHTLNAFFSPTNL